MSTLATPCPHCQRDLATHQRGKHCSPENSTTCTWIRCSCKAVVDPKRGLHIHEDDTVAGRCTGSAA